MTEGRIENGFRISAIDFVLFWFHLLFAGLALVFSDELPRPWTLVSLYATGAFLAALLPWAVRDFPPQGQMLLRGAVALLAVPICFASLGFVLQHVSPDDRHWQILAFDRWIFGEEHLRAIHNLGNPVLTDLLQMAYGSFYFLPLILLGALFVQKRWAGFETVLATVLFGFLFSYLLYFFCPVRSPNEILPGLWQKGWIVAESMAQSIRQIEFLKRDCFPSGHTMMTLITLGLAWRFHRRLFWFFYPIGIGIWVATVYMGYHYVIDLIAGALCAGFVLQISARGWFAPGSATQGEPAGIRRGLRSAPSKGFSGAEGVISQVQIG